jgi:hypothetical protein
VLKILESKNARIDLELRSNPDRSDREIGRICGVDGKTVRAHRAKIPQLAPENSAADSALANFGGENAQLGSLFAQEDCPPLQDCLPGPENCSENCPREEIEAETPPDEPDETVLLPSQGEITIGWNEDGGLILRQANWPDEDSVIIVASDYLWLFIDRLTDAMGIPSTKGLTR